MNFPGLDGACFDMLFILQCPCWELTWLSVDILFSGKAKGKY